MAIKEADTCAWQKKEAYHGVLANVALATDSHILVSTSNDLLELAIQTLQMSVNRQSQTILAAGTNYKQQ